MCKIIHMRRIFLFVAFFSIFVVSSSAIALPIVLPPNWPWRGVVVTSIAPPDAKDMQYLNTIGVNAVNIHLLPRDRAKMKKISGKEVFKQDLVMLDAFLKECKRRGITAVISIAQFPLEPSKGLTQDSPEFWDNPELLKEAVYAAGELARTFHNRGKELAAYSILSEPLVIRDVFFAGIKLGTTSEVPQVWPELMKNIVKEIRKYDKTRFIAVTPGIGGMPAGYEDFKPVGDPYIIYEAHMYEPHFFTHQGVSGRAVGFKYPGGILLGNYTLSETGVWDAETLTSVLNPLIKFQRRYNVPVWIGEFSAIRWAQGGDEYVSDLIGIFDSKGWAWTYHCFKCWHGWDPDYTALGATADTLHWKLDYRGRNTMRWRLLRAAFKKNKLSGKRAG